MTAASEARRIALMLNDSKWQEIEEEIATALKMARYAGMLERDKALPDVQRWYRAFWVGGIDADEHYCRRGGIVKGADVGCCAGLPDPQFAWRHQPDGVR